MPLPPALLARLAKRGIIKEQPQPPPPKPEEVEEVFAEDYDDPSKPEPAAEPKVTAAAAAEDEDSGVEDDGQYMYEVVACPNKSNPFHTCVKFCQTHWGLKTFNPDPKMLARRDRMLKKYPLPDGWKEVADPETNRYYYWSMQTDQVCWLSPGHPKADITMSAEKLQAAASGRDLLSTLDEEFEEGDEDNAEDDRMSADSDMSDSMSDSDSEEERRRSRSQRERDLDRRGGRSRGSFRDRESDRKGRKRRDDLDPMDPAAYSDIPRGGWTDGLDTRGSAKTGVDTTASGPLFQQRPYPSPGEILRQNQQSKKKPAV